MSYAGPGQPYAAPAGRSSGMAVAALVLGIIALISCWTFIGGLVFGILSLVLGIIAVRRAGRGEAGGRGMAIGGIVTGAIGLVVAIAFIAAGSVFFISNHKAISRYQSCLNRASGDQTAIQRCEDRFRSQVSGS